MTPIPRWTLIQWQEWSHSSNHYKRHWGKNHVTTTGCDSLCNKTVITHHPCWHFSNMICWIEAFFRCLDGLDWTKLLLDWTLEKTWRATSDGAKTNDDTLCSANTASQKTFSQKHAAEGDQRGQEAQMCLGEDGGAYSSTRSSWV